jgi:sulfite exporter TauE/SafE
VSALIVTAFVAGLAGSLHCAGMCGAFVAFAVGPGEFSARRHIALQTAYNGGRLVTYSMLGAVAGLLGAALDLGGNLFGIQRAAILVTGGLMILFGAVSLLRILGVRIARIEPPQLFRDAFLRAQGLTRRFAPVPRAFCIGLLSTLLPCGLLYAIAIWAAGTGSAWRGATTMAAFWTGTLPLLVALGAGIGRVAGPLRRHAPTVTALALMAIGLLALSGRLSVPPLSAAVEAVPCHAP